MAKKTENVIVDTLGDVVIYIRRAYAYEKIVAHEAKAWRKPWGNYPKVLILEYIDDSGQKWERAFTPDTSWFVVQGTDLPDPPDYGPDATDPSAIRKLLGKSARQMYATGDG